MPPHARRTPSGLTPLQERFCAEYVIDLNASAAVLRAGYRVRPNRAPQAGYALLQRPEVQRRIQEIQQERSQRLQITADQVLRELAILAFSDIRNYKFVNGELVAEDPIQLRAVQQYSYHEYEGGHGKKIHRELKLWNKLQALQMLGNHLGMFKTIHELQSNSPLLHINAVQDDIQRFVQQIEASLPEANPEQSAKEEKSS